MNRRDALKRFVGAPLAAAGAAAVTPPARRVHLAASAVRADLRVYDAAGTKTFRLTLLEKPWPEANDIIQFDYRELHLVGTVTHVTAEAPFADDRVFLHVVGLVDAFTGADVRG
jgi:hypothetical protein